MCAGLSGELLERLSRTSGLGMCPVTRASVIGVLLVYLLLVLKLDPRTP